MRLSDVCAKFSCFIRPRSDLEPLPPIRDEVYYGPTRLAQYASQGVDISKLKTTNTLVPLARGLTQSAYEMWNQQDDDGMITIPWTFADNFPTNLPCNSFGLTDGRQAVRDSMAALNKDLGCIKLVELSGRSELENTKFANGLVFIYQPEPWEAIGSCTEEAKALKASSSSTLSCFSALGRAPGFNRKTNLIYPNLSDAAPGKFHVDSSQTNITLRFEINLAVCWYDYFMLCCRHSRA